MILSCRFAINAELIAKKDVKMTIIVMLALMSNVLTVPSGQIVIRVSKTPALLAMIVSVFQPLRTTLNSTLAQRALQSAKSAQDQLTLSAAYVQTVSTSKKTQMSV